MFFRVRRRITNEIAPIRRLQNTENRRLPTKYWPKTVFIASNEKSFNFSDGD